MIAAPLSCSKRPVYLLLTKKIYMQLKSGLLLVLIWIGALGVNAQKGEDREFRRHEITLVMGNAHVPSGLTIEGGNKWLVLTSWGLDYDYRLNEKWAISLQTDLIIENFEVKAFKTNPEEFLERSYPFTIALAGMYELTNHFAIIAGSGIEIASEENLYVLRLGLDYGWEIDESWGIGLTLLYDYKVDAYDSLTFGVGASRLF